MLIGNVSLNEDWKKTVDCSTTQGDREQSSATVCFTVWLPSPVAMIEPPNLFLFVYLFSACLSELPSHLTGTLTFVHVQHTVIKGVKVLNQNHLNKISADTDLQAHHS